MKKTAITTILFMLSSMVASAEMRTWTSKAGTTLEAEFVEVKRDKVVLKTTDGQTKQIPVSKLVKADRVLIAQLDNPFSDQNKPDTKIVEKPVSEAIIELFGDELRDSRKKKVSINTLTDKTIGIYFSAHWCPPCRAFTPQLVDFHNEMTKQGNPFEIVFVSSDRDKSSMYNYMEEMDMPWVALPFGDDHKQALAQKFHVSGIPKLVIIDSAGNLITENGRGDVGNNGEKAFDTWTK